MMLAMLLQVAAPTTAIEAERAMAEVALADGHEAALRRFAAPDAVILLPEGMRSANSSVAPQAGVRHVTGSTSSCDGTGAVNFGLIEYPDGSMGNFQSVWLMTVDGTWQWHVIGGAMLPKPVTVGGLHLQRARCDWVGNPGDYPYARKDATRAATLRSHDGTLAYHWSWTPGGNHLRSAGVWNGVAWDIIQFKSERSVIYP